MQSYTLRRVFRLNEALISGIRIISKASVEPLRYHYAD